MIKRSCREVMSERKTWYKQRPSGVEGLDDGMRNVEVSTVDRLFTKSGLGRRSPHATPFLAKQYKHNGRRGTVAEQGLVWLGGCRY